MHLGQNRDIRGCEKMTTAFVAKQPQGQGRPAACLPAHLRRKGWAGFVQHLALRAGGSQPGLTVSPPSQRLIDLRPGSFLRRAETGESSQLRCLFGPGAPRGAAVLRASARWVWPRLQALLERRSSWSPFRQFPAVISSCQYFPGEQAQHSVGSLTVTKTQS